MAYPTAWCIGSARSLDLDLSISGSPQTITGDLYLHHPTSTLSLLGRMVAKMTAAGVAGAAAVLTQDRRVKLSAGGTFSVTWTDVALRELLGFSGNLAAASSYTATLISPLLWSPAKPLMSELSPQGTIGIVRPLSYFSSSPSDGSTFVASHGTRTDQRWSATHIAVDRWLTASGLGGEWMTWWTRVAAAGYSFYVYPTVTEEAGSTTTATLTGGLGPYAWTPSGRAPQTEYRRSAGFAFSDRRADVTIPCRVVPEYT